MASEEFEKAVKAWVDGVRDAEYNEKQLSDAYARRDEAAGKLAKLIIPTDVKQGEVIAVWVRTGYKEERLVAVKWNGGSNYEVAFRGRTREVEEI